MKLVFATQNSNKAKEIQSLLPEGFEVLTLKDINCHDDIPETALTLDGNAELKAQYVLDKFKMNCFADDTGLEIDGLDGEPGVFSARYAGDQKNSEDNMELVLSKMDGMSNRKAQFRTSICLIIDRKKYFFEGIIRGEITTSKKGTDGFGYDPIFQPEGYDQTFAEMSLEQKNEMSHRGRAIREMIEFLSRTL